MQPSSKPLSHPNPGRYPFFLGAIFSLIFTAAHAQNIDEGKSAPRLFADSCATCHHNARSLAKGRFRPTLFLFLQDHYTTSSSAAWELSSYLASVDNRQGGRSQHAPRSTTRAPRPAQPPSVRSN
jgi:mono/diheme cytochrome c family protein